MRWLRKAEAVAALPWPLMCGVPDGHGRPTFMWLPDRPPTKRKLEHRSIIEAAEAKRERRRERRRRRG